MIVLDASAVLELLLATAGGNAVRRRIVAASETLHAPHLIDLEVTQVLRRYCSSGVLSAARGAVALEDFRSLDLERYAHEPLLQRIWRMRASVTAYDAAYLALAEALDATLLTFDAKLRAAPGHKARIELLQ